MGLGRGAFGSKGSLLRAQIRNVARDGIRRLGRLGLAALQPGKGLAGGSQILFIHLNFRLLGCQTLGIGPISGIQGILFPAGRALCLGNGIVEHLVLLFLTLEPEHLILCLPELIPGSGHLKLHLVKESLTLLQLGFLRHFLLLQLLFLLGQPFQLIGPGENARILIYRTAGHGAAGVHHLSIQGYDAEAIFKLLCHGNGCIQILGNHRPAQKIQDDIFILGVALYQIRGHPYKAPAVFNAGLLQAFAPDIGQRQEGGASAAGTLEVADGGLAIDLRIHNDLLHCRTQSNFNGNGILIIRANQPGNRAVDIPQCAPLGLLHNHPHGFCIAFIIPLHSAEHPHLGRNSVQLGRKLPQFLCGGISGLSAVFLAQRKAGTHIVGSRNLLLGVFQLPAAVLQVLLCLLQAVGSGRKISVQLRQAGHGGFAVFLHRPNLRLAPGNIRREGRFFGAQLQKLLAQALSRSGHFTELLLGSTDGLANIRKIPFNLGKPLGSLGNLAINAAGAILLALDFLFDAGNIPVVVFHIAPEHCHLAFQLLVGALEHGGFYPDGFQCAVLFPQCFPHFLGLTVEAVQLIMGLLQDKRRRGIVLLRFLCRSGKLIQGIQPNGNLHALELFLHLQVFLCFFRLGL